MADPRGDQFAPEDVFAAHLTKDHIGTLVRFRMTNENLSLSTVVTAELRQVTHYGDHTVLVVGANASCQYEQCDDDRVILRPLPDYSDVATFLGNDPEEVQWTSS